MEQSYLRGEGDHLGEQNSPAKEQSTEMQQMGGLPGASEDNYFFSKHGLELARKLQMVVRQREQFKRRSTELEEELRLCRATVLKLRQDQKNIIRATIRKAVEVAVENTRNQLEKKHAEDIEKQHAKLIAATRTAEAKHQPDRLATPVAPAVTTTKKPFERRSISKLLCRVCVLFPIICFVVFVLLLTAQAMLWIGVGITWMQNVPPLRLILYPGELDFHTTDLSPDTRMEYVLLNAKSDKGTALEWFATSNTHLDSEVRPSDLDGVFLAKQGHGLAHEALATLGLSVSPPHIKQISLPSKLGHWLLHEPRVRELKQAWSLTTGSLAALSTYTKKVVAWQHRVVRCVLETTEEGLWRRACVIVAT